MWAREKKLASILASKGINVCSPVVIERTVFSKSKYHEELNKVYKTLGGIQEHYPFNIGKFDIEKENYSIELDEENHFTRYRKVTLGSTIYNGYKFFKVPEYISYCGSFEDKAPAWGGYWTKPSCEKQFGISSPPKDFSGNGSARWKQRAFYDYLKDVYSLIISKPLLRFSIYDQIGDQTIGKILASGKDTDGLFDAIYKIKLLNNI